MILLAHGYEEQQLGRGSAKQQFHLVLPEATSAAAVIWLLSGAGWSKMASLMYLVAGAGHWLMCLEGFSWVRLSLLYMTSHLLVR